MAGENENEASGPGTEANSRSGGQETGVIPNTSVSSSPEACILRAINRIGEIAARQQPRSDWKKLFGWKQCIPEIEKETLACLEKLLPANIETQRELLKIITERRNQLALESGITSEIVGICKQILAFGAGGLGLSLAFADKAQTFSVRIQQLLAISGIFYFELVIVSLIVLLLYLLQARFRYPFLYFEEIGNSWPWFYYASISKDVPRCSVQLPGASLRAITLYAEDLLKFSERVVTEDSESRLRAAIQQYFLLISYQGYVNQFSLRLVSVFMYGFAGTVASATILILLIFGGCL